MFQKSLSISVAVLLTLSMLPAQVQAAPDIEVLPAALDFADVDVGTMQSMMVTVQNVGTHPLLLNTITLSVTSNPAFSITLAPVVPVYVDPGASEVVEITFSPDSTGAADAQLKITSNSPGEEEVLVDLTGNGVGATDPCVAIDGILRFFDDSVAAGTLYGNGPGNSGNGRKKALRNMIRSSCKLVEQGRVVKACQQLMDAYERTDGMPRPPEFVAGPAAPELAGMLAELRAEMGCE